MVGMQKFQSSSRPGAVAIIGMAGRFPGASTLDEFWQNLCRGAESITRFTVDELAAAGVDHATLVRPNYVRARAIIADRELFDASFFGFNPRDAELLDPQQRLFLETAWSALEHAGYDGAQWPGRIGVYAGASMSVYYLNNVLGNKELVQTLGAFHIMLGNDKDHLATLTAYKLNLTGPAVTIQTACSTSLVAVHLACQSLLAGESDLMLVGGVALNTPVGYLYQEGGILSPDGHCRAFDAAAQGTVIGEGVGVVVLKRLDDALADCDTIYAVIKGSAINNDGSSKAGYTAPSVQGQAQVIAEALAMAGIPADTVSYIEAHGTATPLGDPIEIMALTQAYGQGRDAHGFCALGSVKTNIGHLDTAAGIAGLLKTVLALWHRQIPPSLHFAEPNPHIDFQHSPFYVNTRLSDWSAGPAPRRAGVSSFGMGGTNAHLVLEEAPEPSRHVLRQSWQLLVLSARSAGALDAATVALAEHLQRLPDANLADVAYTLQVGRRTFEHRRTVVCQDSKDAAAALVGQASARVFTTWQEERDRPVIFMFPGQGAQYVYMARGLYNHEPSFRAQLDLAAERLAPELGTDLRELLYPGADAISAAQRLDETRLTQPTLFAVEYALAQLWISWGVRPQAMIGHSLGEYVAACIAGVFSFEEGLGLVEARGRLIAGLPRGGMLAVALPESEVMPFLDRRLALAAVNGSKQCVVAGPDDAVNDCARQLAARGTACQRLHTSHAFHSAMMDSALDPLRARAGELHLRPPQVPYISNLTGQWVQAAEATDPNYWARQLRGTVRFNEGVVTLLADTRAIFLEVGPGHVLGSLVRQQADPVRTRTVLASLPHPADQQTDEAFALTTLGRLWANGVHVDWTGVHRGRHHRRVPLPTYPFERQRFWVESPQVATHPKPTAARLLKRTNIADWFYVPIWRRSAPLWPMRAPPVPGARWLVLGSSGNVGDRLAQRLAECGQDVVRVAMGAQFGRQASAQYILNAALKEDYLRLVRELQGWRPEHIVHGWSVLRVGTVSPEGDRFAAAQVCGLHSLLYLVQALEAEDQLASCTLTVLVNGAHDVTGDEELWPETVPLLGACKVIPQEYSGLCCRSIDLGTPDPDGLLLDQCVAELCAPTAEPVVAYRGQHRWLPEFASLPLHEPPDEALPLRRSGVYLIIGGLGQIGLTLAGYLADTVQARLALIGRTPLPPPNAWQSWLSAHAATDPTSKRIRQVQALEAFGGEPMTLAADISDAGQLQRALAAVQARFGALNGVIHAAGLSLNHAFATVSETSPAMCQLHFGPKALGLVALREVLAGAQLDFCLITSSLASVLGGVGRCAYTAASLYVDAFVQRERRIGGLPWQSLNWDGWQFAESGIPWGAKKAEEEFDLAILAAEGVATFRRALGAVHTPQLVVSTADLAARTARSLASTVRLAATKASNPSQGTIAAEFARPGLREAYVAPRDRHEQVLVGLWGELLGIADIGIHDNFFDLGAHSLVAIQLISRIRDVFGVEVPVGKLFAGPTVAELADLLHQTADLSTRIVDDSAELARLLDVVKGLPDKQIEQLRVGDGSAVADAGVASQATAPQKAVHEAAGLRQPPAQERKAEITRYYDAISRWIDATPFGPYAQFLNYGYIVDPKLDSEAVGRVNLGPHAFNRASLQLVLEVTADCDLQGARILDVGCGRGGTCVALANLFAAQEVYGIDLSPAAIAFCRRTNQQPHVHFSIGDAEQLPFADGRFDVVTNIESSHSYPDPDAFYVEVFRVLRSGGHFLYADLLPAESIEARLSSLAALGFIRETSRDITAEVVTALDHTAAQRLSAFAGYTEPEDVREFLAVPGSKVYANLYARRWSYMIFRFRKSERQPAGSNEPEA
jgi:acyl transferase domain-containing protein/SAM-dependent methyltransferase/acyl carrier protein